MEIDGNCYCGSIRYRATIDPARVSVCHCTDCQQLTGSPFRVTVLCDRAQLDLGGEQPRIYRKTGQSGRTRLMYFCRNCGTPLFASAGDAQGEWGIRWGSIRQREQLTPRRQIWCGSVVPWIDKIDALQNDGNP